MCYYFGIAYSTLPFREGRKEGGNEYKETVLYHVIIHFLNQQPQ